MIERLQHLLTLLILVVASGSVCSQSVLSIPIQSTAEGLTLAEFLSELEADHPVRFFLASAELPPAPLNRSYKGTPLGEVLQDLLAGTPLGFIGYRDYAVVIAPRDKLLGAYTPAYYRALERAVIADADPGAEETLTVGSIRQLRADGDATVSGRITDARTGRPVEGATVFFPSLEVGQNADEEGRFSLTVPAGKHLLTVLYIGYQTLEEELQVWSDGELDLQIRQEGITLGEVTVEAEAPDANIARSQVGLEQLDMQLIEKLPTFLGEADLIRNLLLYPGVSTIGEGAIGFNVRGGAVDQNLILQDEGFILNPSHALGFFSTFNTDLVNSVTLYKGNIPAQFGGRIASVMDVELRDGSFEKLKVRGGAGPVSSRLTLEGPLPGGRTSFLLGLRASYLNWILKAAQNLDVKRSSAYFYDTHLRLTHRFDEFNTLSVSGYLSDDEFSFSRQFGFDYGTRMLQATYRGIINDELYSRFSATYSRYRSNQLDLEGADGSRIATQVQYLKLKETLHYEPRPELQLTTGLMGVMYWVDPADLTPEGNISLIQPRSLDRQQGLETAAFLQADWEVSPALSLSGGLRVSWYQFLGPQTVFSYADPDRPDKDNATGSTFFGSGKSIAGYAALEPRLSGRYRLNAAASIKGGYSRTVQYLSQIFNTDTPTPGSQFQLSTDYIEPQRSHNFSLGYFRNFAGNLWETSLEGYYRIIDATFDYRDFADLVVNPQLETEILPGEGRAYGLEMSLKKNSGQVNGLVSYTFSRTENKIAGINRGAWYPANFDMPHNLTVVLNYQLNGRNTFTLNFNYNTGRPTTVPVGSYTTDYNLIIPIYSDRNQLRIPDYHRLDLAYTLGQGYNKTKKFKTSWTFSLYNVYGRRNAFSVFYVHNALQPAKARQLSLLGSIFPALTFNFELQ